MNNLQRSDVSKVAKGAGTSLVGIAVGRGLFFLNQVIIARVLGAESFGLYALGLALIRLAAILSSGGLNTGGTRFVSIYAGKDPARLKGAIFSTLSVSVLNSVLIAMAVLLFGHLVTTTLFQRPDLDSIVKLFALGLPFDTLLYVISNLLLGFQTTRFTVYIKNFIQPVADSIFLIFFCFSGFGLSGAIYAFIFSYGIASLFGIYFLIKIFPGLRYSSVRPVFAFKEIMAYSAPLLFVTLLQYFITWLDTLMLGYFGSPEDVAVFRAASQFPQMMMLFLVATGSIYSSMAASCYSEGEIARFSNIFRLTTKWISYIVIPIFLFLVFSSKEIMLIFGSQYVASGQTALILLSIGQLINCMTGCCGLTLMMTSRQSLELFNTTCVVFLSILADIFLIPRYSVLGAAISNCLALSLVNVIRILELNKLYKIRIVSQGIGRYTFPIVFSISFFIIEQYVMKVHFHYIIQILFNFSIVAFVFGMYWILVRNKLDTEDRLVFELALNRFHASHKVS